ncbi:MAG: chemotaxis response regulator protein-glutamate methylesterase [Hyphomicrobiales bacterium]|nr:MAG: chemotaxis response regulator protein-glutamate methylesterase [Hyphomicrobiales bacterium]
MTVSALNKATPATGAATTQPIKVMIVDDAIVVRGLVGKWLDEEPDIEVVVKHRNGKDAVDDVVRADPDVVLLDIEMPVMDGMTALQKMLVLKPGLCVIMASTLTQRNAEISMKALKLGAMDYLPKPERNGAVSTSQDFKRDIINKTRALGGAARSRRARKLAQASAIAPAARSAAATARPRLLSEINKPSGQSFSLRPYSKILPRILVIGSSTGGPQALMEVMRAIGPNIGKIPVVIAQHMPPNFTAILAKNLGKESGRPTQEATDDGTLEPGNVYVAPGGVHTVLYKEGARIFTKLEDTPPINFCKPAVDPMFISASEIYGPAILSVILTGMGADGAGGVKLIAEKGGSIITQDEDSCVVFGMPKAAVETGCCSAILPLSKIGSEISRILKGGRP